MAKLLRTRFLAVVFFVSSIWLFVTLFLFDVEDEIKKTNKISVVDPQVNTFRNLIKKANDFMKLSDNFSDINVDKLPSRTKYEEKMKRKAILRKWREDLLNQDRSMRTNSYSNNSSYNAKAQLPNSKLKTTLKVFNSNHQKVLENLLQRNITRIKRKRDSEETMSRKASERDRLRHLEKVASPDAPGEYGRPVRINKKELSSEQQKVYNELFKRNSFNQYASDMISFQRRLRDIRNPSCQQETYPKNLPSTSIIICFHNEAWSVLLRTVHSILNRTPPELVHEVILVDDFSDLDFLKEELDEYLLENGSGKVRVLRTAKREGLIRARLLGYEAASGEILTFLDSHIECFPGWLEPLLARIAEDHTRVVAPVIDMISDQSMACWGNEIGAVGTFDLTIMGFKWLNLEKKAKKEHHPTKPWRCIVQQHNARSGVTQFDNVFVAVGVQVFQQPVGIFMGTNCAPLTPTIAGGLFSINRDYFTKMGTYDQGMDIWGGENLEISFRTWMCGGSLEIHPCSHVAHIFRSVSPYKWGKSFAEILRKNAVRTAEVWLDEFKHLYFERINYDLGNYGDVSHRKDLRQRLGCKSFEWYLKTLLPEMKLPEKALYSGEVRNMETGLCLDTMGTVAGNKFHAIPCHGMGGNQFFRYTISGRISRDTACLTDKNGSISYILCKNNVTNWDYTQENEIRMQHTNSCLSLNKNSLNVLPCNKSSNQKWIWTRKIDGDSAIK